LQWSFLAKVKQGANRRCFLAIAHPGAPGFFVYRGSQGVVDRVADRRGLSDAIKHAISAQKDVTRSITLELISTFGPTGWLMAIGLMPGRQRVLANTRSPAREERRHVAAAPVVAKQADATPDTSDPFQRFVTDDRGWSSPPSCVISVTMDKMLKYLTKLFDPVNEHLSPMESLRVVARAH
jgi:hypothetical protein